MQARTKLICVAIGVSTMAGAAGLGWARDGLLSVTETRAVAAAEADAATELAWARAQDWLAYHWGAASDAEGGQFDDPFTLFARWLGSRAANLRGHFSEPDFQSSVAQVTASVEPLALTGPTLSDILVVYPVDGELSSPFGTRRDPFTKRRKMHKGLDFKADRGTPVRAAGAGVVEVARRRGGYGRVVMIDHGMGMETRYAHLQRIQVAEGQFVTAGTQVGTVGSSGRATGPHLHFEIRIAGEAIDPALVLEPDQSLTDGLEQLWDWLL